jgi:multidrug efflux pump
MNITEICIKKPVFAWMIMASTVLFGLVAASRIGISQFPDVDFPTITVSVSWEGASPEAMEQDVVEVIEEAVTQAQGIKSINSTSRQGSANITIELELSRDVDAAMQDVQAKVSGARRQLPRDIDEPQISKSNPEDQPIMWVGLSGPFSRAVLADTVKYRIKEKFQTLPGVGEVTLGGYLERNIRIWVQQEKLDEKDLTVSDITRALTREHVEMPAGTLAATGREVNVRVMGEAIDLETLRNIVVREVNGQPVYLKQVCIVEDGFEDERRLSRVNGVPAQGMGIRKQRGSNAVEVAKNIKREMAEIQKTLPEGMELAVNFDSTQFIEESVHEIEFELIVAVILTALVCWIFLGSLSSTLNVILAIPMSLLGTIAIIYFLGFTLNTFTLLALALAVGIVVDDAIMVMENIFRHAEEGKDKVRAAREGTAEITFAALAATIAVIAIFVPVVFMEGVIGKFFLQFGVTLSLAVMLSYVEAVTLAPARCAQMIKLHKAEGKPRIVDRAFDGLKRGYEKTLRVGLRASWLVLIIAGVLFAGSIWLLSSLQAEFVPSQDQSRLMIRLTTAVGSDIRETDELFKKAEAILATKPEIKRSFGAVGGFGGSGVNSGVLFVTMAPPNERQKTQNQIAGELRKELNAIPGLKAVVQDLSQQGFTSQRGFPIEFSVRGPDFNKLVEYSGQMKEKLAETGMAVDIDTDYQIGMPELRILPDRARANDLGVSVQDVATTINALIGGVRVGKFASQGRRLDVRMRLVSTQRSRPEDIAKLKVRSGSGKLVPLSLLVKYEERPVLQSIIRKDRERAISIFANVAPGYAQSDALAKITELGATLPAPYRAVPGGASVAFKESMTSLLFAMVLGIFVAYMVLASQFNSFLHPVTVLTILPLSVAGAAIALWSGGLTLNIFSMIGLLLLMGIVKKNSIILVDYANQLRETGLSAHDAMLKAGPVRLRPILMTSFATLVAALPAALALGPGGETRKPMALSVIGGMIVATALSLLVVPAFYVVSDTLKGMLSRKQPKPIVPELEVIADTHPPTPPPAV